MVSIALAEWAEAHAVRLEFIKPGKPMQNGFIERFNRRYRQAVLDMYVFQTLNEVREHTEKWLKEYNEERPHESLGDLTPREFLLTKTGNLYSNVVLITGTFTRLDCIPSSFFGHTGSSSLLASIQRN